MTYDPNKMSMSQLFVPDSCICAGSAEVNGNQVNTSVSVYGDCKEKVLMGGSACM